MKVKKIILNLLTVPGLLFSLISPACAAQDTIDSDLYLHVPAYISITKDSSSVTSVNATVTDSSTLSIPTITAKYNVLSNGSAKVYVYAKTPTSGEPVNALYKIDSNTMRIVMAQSNGTTSASAVTDCGSGSASATSNEGAIAFQLTCANPTNSAAATMANNSIEYTVSGGKTVLCYTISGNALAGTFSLKDPPTNYKATLYLSTIEP